MRLAVDVEAVGDGICERTGVGDAVGEVADHLTEAHGVVREAEISVDVRIRGDANPEPGEREAGGLRRIGSKTELRGERRKVGILAQDQSEHRRGGVVQDREIELERARWVHQLVQEGGDFRRNVRLDRAVKDGRRVEVETGQARKVHVVHVAGSRCRAEVADVLAQIEATERDRNICTDLTWLMSGSSCESSWTTESIKVKSGPYPAELPAADASVSRLTGPLLSNSLRSEMPGRAR